jgi:asparagine synthase (glutamine-hydrolysing)
VRFLPDVANGHPGLSRLKRFLASARKPAAQRYADFVTTFSPDDRARLVSREFLSGEKPCLPEESILDTFASRDADSLLHSMLLCDMKMYLPGDLLSLTDRVSMHHSLEVRVPFLDHPLIELTAQIPEKYKLSLRSKKILFKQAFGALLPPNILHRRKLGFSVPMGLWLRTDLKSFMCDLLSKERVKAIGYLNAVEVENIIAEHVAGRANHENKLWGLMNLVSWHQPHLSMRRG